MDKQVILGSALALVLGAGAIMAATPFGADDSGFIPPDAPKGPITKCEVSVGKTVGKEVASIIKCHGSRAVGKLADNTAEDTCESSAITKLGAKPPTGCAPCTNFAGTLSGVAALTDANNNLVWCDNTGTAFGGDDTGFIPTDAPKGKATKCSLTVSKGVGKLVAAIGKCHASRAVGKLADDTAEDACESAAVTKFGTTKTTGCPACVNVGTIGTQVASLVDSNNVLTYCASPSGAFVE